MKEIILAVSITINIFLLALVWILFYRSCKHCCKDKEISRVFNKICEKCEKGNGEIKRKKAEMIEKTY